MIAAKYTLRIHDGYSAAWSQRLVVADQGLSSSKQEETLRRQLIREATVGGRVRGSGS